MPATSEPRVFETEDGSRSLYSERFGVSYHSKFGALRETEHIFIQYGLLDQAKRLDAIRVLEVGYGTGLNCLATLRAVQRGAFSVSYLGLDPEPPAAKLTAALDYPGTLELTAEELRLARRLVDTPWDVSERLSPKLTVEKRRQRLEDFHATGGYDLVYFDAFAPEAQPELWTLDVFKTVYGSLESGGTLVTYCAKGQVKRDLRSAGFTVERLSGPPGKREITRARKA